jgi:hypothetical protein
MRLVLAIRDYAPGAVFDHFDDGSFATFDAVDAELVGGEREGERLHILVEPDSDDAGLWNRPGQTIEVSIRPELLASPTLFSAAFTIEGEG